METILEQQRRYHEEKERLMDVMAKEMLTKKSTVSGARAGALLRLGLSPALQPPGAFLGRRALPETRPAPHALLGLPLGVAAWGPSSRTPRRRGLPAAAGRVSSALGGLSLSRTPPNGACPSACLCSSGTRSIPTTAPAPCKM